jgi:hypothetical protein
MRLEINPIQIKTIAGFLLLVILFSVSICQASDSVRSKQLPSRKKIKPWNFRRHIQGFCGLFLRLSALIWPVSDDNLSCPDSASIPWKSSIPIRPATPTFLSGSFQLSFKSQSGIFVPGLAAYSYSYASSSLVGLKKASDYFSWPSFFRLFSIALMS